MKACINPSMKKATEQMPYPMKHSNQLVGGSVCNKNIPDVMNITKENIEIIK